MFDLTTYPGAVGPSEEEWGLGFLGAGDTAWVSLGYPSKAAWNQAGRPKTQYVPNPNTPIANIQPIPAPTPVTPSGGGSLTIPTTEPNQCPPGMTYAAPPPGSGTGTCTGPTDPTVGTSGGGLGGLLSSIPSTYLLIGAAILIYTMVKK